MLRKPLVVMHLDILARAGDSPQRRHGLLDGVTDVPVFQRRRRLIREGEPAGPSTPWRGPGTVATMASAPAPAATPAPDADASRMRRAGSPLLLLLLVAGALGPGSTLIARPSALADEGPTLRVAAYNIKHGRGMDDVVDLARIAEVLTTLDADVVTLQEVDRRTERTDGVDQTGVLADLVGYDGSFGAHRPYQGGEYGNAVLTRSPIRATRTHPIPAAGGSALSVHEVEIELADFGTVSVVSVHLAGSVEERMAQAREVTRVFEGVSRPVVLAGDFNGRPDDPVVQWLGRRWTILAKEDGRFTYPAADPDREIDFVMVSRGWPIEIVEHVVHAESLASDHRPLVATIRFGVGG